MVQGVLSKNTFSLTNKLNIETFIVVFFKALVCICSLLMLTQWVHAQIPLQNEFKNVDKNLRNKVAQKIILDLRYFCRPKAQGNCQQALTELPDELAVMLSKAKVGGVILFKENLVSAEQIIKFNHQLQMAAMFGSDVPDYINNDASKDVTNTNKQKSDAVPLYIAIDQEGGRVSRLPQSVYWGFAGNMAIGATYVNEQDKYAKLISERSAEALLELGFNLNFAPVVDVNSNPNNPVINVRAYSQSAQIVSELGAAAITAMQNKGIATAAKHFPGHGDTYIDSHIGLPRVDHDIEVIDKVDLLPYKNIIKNKATRPDMIMTAHIQYPNLDSTPFRPKEMIEMSAADESILESAVLPATLSKKILTDLLRDKLDYQGIIVTDALDMASITKFLSPTEAVIKSFRAGADITLMPFHISSPEDAIDFLDWLNEVTIFIAQDPELVAMVETSYERILKHKNKRKMKKRATLSLQQKLTPTTDSNIVSIKMREDEKLAKALAKASFSQIKPLKNALKADANLLVIMPDKQRCNAFLHYWSLTQGEHEKNVKCISMLSQTMPLSLDRLKGIDALIVGDVFPALAFHESKQYEGIEAHQRKNLVSQQNELQVLLNQAVAEDVPRVLLKMRSPDISTLEYKIYTAIYASYDYQAAERKYVNSGAKNTHIFAPAMHTFIEVLLGQSQPQGQLPVRLSDEVQALILQEISELKTK